MREVLAAAVDDGVAPLFGQVLPGGVQGVAVAPADVLELLKNPRGLVGSQRGQGAVAQAESGVGYHLFEGEFAHRSQAVAVRTRAFGRVETERIGFGLRVGESGGRTHQVAAEVLLGLAVPIHHRDAAVPEAHRDGDAALEAVFVVSSRAQPVDHHVDVVGFVAVQLESAVNVDPHPVDAGLEVALLGEALKKFAVVPFSGPDHGGQDGHARPVEVAKHALEDGVVGVAHHFFAGGQRIGGGGSRVQQAQKVVHLGHRAHGGTRIPVGGFLLDRHHGRKALNAVDVGPFHGAQKLAGVAAEGLHVAPLPLGKQRVEGERGFSASA